MVLTKSELIGSLQHEVRILVHLSSKNRSRDARLPSDTQAAQHHRVVALLDDHGTDAVKFARAGTFDPAQWTVEEKAAAARDFDQTVAAIAAQSATYASLIGEMSDADLRGEIEMFGNKTTRGAFLVNLVLCGHAAYRTQLFVYLKACGRDELTTMNLWAGADAPAVPA